MTVYVLQSPLYHSDGDYDDSIIGIYATHALAKAAAEDFARGILRFNPVHSGWIWNEDETELEFGPDWDIVTIREITVSGSE